MRNLDNLEFYPVQEDVVKILQDRTQNAEPMFFRLMLAYFLAKIASMMRITVYTEIFDAPMPVNLYAINLAPSGSGKGRSVNIIEDHIIDKFKLNYLTQTFNVLAEENLSKLAVKRSVKKNTDQQSEYDYLQEDFKAAGPMVFGFDSGTSAAVKQMRHKLLLANSGSMNMEIDEIGSNLMGNADVLTSFLELFDVGKIKQKLTKHTKENARSEEVFGRTPTNMMLFGTPTKLLDGSRAEQQFYEMLETGFARRCFFGYSRHQRHLQDVSAEEIYDIMRDPVANNQLLLLSEKLGKLGDRACFGQKLMLQKDVGIELIKYRQYCDKKADRFSEYEDMRKAEMKHRYFKTVKLAGVYAFIDQSPNVTEDHLYYAINMAEQSGKAFDRILRRDRPYVKLASYICSINREVTHADMLEDLPFYKGTESARKEMMQLAIAHGYRNNQVIKREVIDDIEFFSGKSLPETELDNIIVSYSNHITTGYVNQNPRWDQLHEMCLHANIHWCVHALEEHPDYPGKGNYRDDARCIPGFNLAVLDVDNGEIDIPTAQMLLKDMQWLMYTTKRHTEEKPRYRIIIPLSHVLELDNNDYKEFMANVYEWLPFDVDNQTNQRTRKWLSNPGQHWYNVGELLDVYQFLPKTKKAEERKVELNKVKNLSALERWFYSQMKEGNRNNLLLRYAYALCDMGHDLDSVKNNVLGLNSKLPEPLAQEEVLNTVLVSASRKIALKQNQAK